MRASVPLRLTLATLLALAAAHARAADGGVCVASDDGAEYAAAANAARRALGGPVSRLEIAQRSQREQLASRCDRLIVAVGPEALKSAATLAPRTPTVHVMAGGGRAGGLGVSPDADPRRVLETLQAMAPRAKRVGVVYDPAQTGPLVEEAGGAARALGLELVALPARSVGEAVRAYYRFEKELDVDALWLLPDGTTTVQETVYYALELAHWRRMVLIGVSRWYVASGALFALVPSPASLGAAAAELAQPVLRGEPPPPLVRARDYGLYVNERTASRLGLRVPRKLLDSAEEVLP
jgi:putative ABC transport system substrate-binding protein